MEHAAELPKQPKTSAQRHAEWYARSHEHALEQKRRYYRTHRRTQSITRPRTLRLLFVRELMISPHRIFFFFAEEGTEYGEQRHGIPDRRGNFRTLFAGRSGFILSC